MTPPLTPLLFYVKVNEAKISLLIWLVVEVAAGKRRGMTNKVTSQRQKGVEHVSTTPMQYSLGRRMKNNSSMESLEMESWAGIMVV